MFNSTIKPKDEDNQERKAECVKLDRGEGISEWEYRKETRKHRTLLFITVGGR